MKNPGLCHQFPRIDFPLQVSSISHCMCCPFPTACVVYFPLHVLSISHCMCCPFPTARVDDVPLDALSVPNGTCDQFPIGCGSISHLYVHFPGGIHFPLDLLSMSHSISQKATYKLSSSGVIHLPPHVLWIPNAYATNSLLAVPSTGRVIISHEKQDMLPISHCQM